MAVPIHHLAGEMPRQSHDRLIRILPFCEAGHEGMAEVVEAAIYLGRLPAKSPRGFPATDWLLRVSVPYGDRAMFEAVLSLEAVPFGREDEMAGKRIDEILPPFGESGKGFLIQRNHATFPSPSLGLADNEAAFQ